MTLTLRIILSCLSVLSSIWVLKNIRKSKMRIEDAVFWLLLSAVLVILSIFPGIVEFGAKITGIQSSQNFLFLAVIAILLIKMFLMSIKISQLEYKLEELVQVFSIEEYSREEHE